MRVYLALITSAALLLSPAVHAATYHVAQRASGADDANPGTLRRPWKTLAQATRHLKPGDTLILHSGVYREKITLLVSGTPATPITLRAADGEQPVITARNNLMLNNGDPRGPAWGTGGIMVSSSPGCVLENNVCAGNRAGIAFREQGRTTPRIDASAGSPEVEVFCAHEIVRRNILAGNWEHQLAFWFDTRFFGPHPSGADTAAPPGRDPGRQGYTLADNLFYAAPGQGLILYGARWRAKATLHPTLASFSRASGIPATGRIAEPRFRDPLAGDFRVTHKSPALPLKAGLANPDVVPNGAG